MTIRNRALVPLHASKPFFFIVSQSFWEKNCPCPPGSWWPGWRVYTPTAGGTSATCRRRLPFLPPLPPPPPPPPAVAVVVSSRLSEPALPWTPGATMRASTRKCPRRTSCPWPWELSAPDLEKFLHLTLRTFFPRPWQLSSLNLENYLPLNLQSLPCQFYMYIPKLADHFCP